MSRLTYLTDLYPFISPELPGCPPAIMLQALQRSARQFCQDSDAWRETLAPIAVVDHQEDYRIDLPYDATVQRLHKVVVNGQEMNVRNYDLQDETFLRWIGERAPYNLDDMLLVCGTAGTDVLATWQAITNGSLTCSIGGATYGATGISFASCTDMDDVASRIQNAIRQAVGTNTAFVVWDSTHFSIYSTAGAMGYLTAGSTGTDISGAGYINGLTGAGALSGYILLDVSLLPWAIADAIPDWLFNRHSETIAAYAKFMLMAQHGKAWTNLDGAELARARYNQGFNRAKGDVIRRYKGGAQEFGA